MTGSPGLLNRVVFDTKVTADEFAELERSVFAGDGVIDFNEDEILQWLQTATDSWSQDSVIFDDSDDLLRLDLLATRRIRTLEQYLEQLRTSAMTPRNAPDVLMNLAESQGPGEPPVHVISVTKSGDSFELEVATGGETYWIHLPEGVFGEGGSLEGTRKLKDFPLDWWEVMEALRRYAEGKDPTDEEREAAIDLAQILHIKFRHQFLTTPQNFRTFVETIRKVQLETGQTEAIQHVALSASDLPEIPVEGDSLFSGCQSESTDPEIGRILSLLRQVIPGRAIEWVRVTQTSLSLLPIHRHLRDFYNRHPEITEPIQFGGFADLTTTPPSIVLNSKEEVADFIYGIVHELGHLVLAMIRGETFTSRKTTGGTRESTSDGVLSAHWEESVRVKEGKGLFSSASPTTYGGVNHEEWFADIFAIYFLGKASRFLEKTLAVSFERIFEDFKQRDPAGYLLMVRLDQYLSGDNRYRPSVTFSWSGLNDVRRFVDESDPLSLSMDQLEQRWRNRPPPKLNAEREYARILATKMDATAIAYRARTERLLRLSRQYPFFYPVVRDLWLEAVKLRMGEVITFDTQTEILATSLSDDEIVTGIGGVMGTVHHDPIVVDELDYFMRSACEHRSRQHHYEGETPEMGERITLMRKLGPIVRKLAREREAAGLALLPYLLVLEGRQAEAARLLQDENSVVYADPKWKRARVALSAFLPDTDPGKSADNLMQLGRDKIGFDLDFWPAMGFQGLVERLQREQQFEALLDLLIKIVDAHPVLLVEVSRVLDRSVVESRLKASPRWEKIRRRFVEKFEPGFLLLDLAVESSGFSSLYGIKWVEKDGLPHPQLAD